MCKDSGKTSANQPTNDEENLNIGLLNMSSNSMSVFSLETIIEIVSLLILSILVLRWVNKWLQKRKALKMQRLQSLMKPTRQSTSFIQELPTAPTQYEPRALMQPQPKHQEQEIYPIGLDKYR